MNRSIIFRWVCIPGVLSALLPSALASSNVQWDPLYVPAAISPLSMHTQLLAIERAGTALVAAGWRGHILVAEDADADWTQMPVPVSVDLTALSFPTATTGWAVGHGGIVLKTRDGGRSWSRQLDGMSTAALMAGYYRPFADAGDEAALQAISEIEINTADGPELPWLDVEFQNERNGLVVGSFNTILETTDGGHTWRPLLDRVDNPEALHLNAVSTIAGTVYLASERGVLFKRDADGSFRRVETGYEGTWFGVVGNASVLLAYGLRGTLWRSQDQGTNWHPVDSGTTASLTGATTLDDGRITLVSQGGDVLLVSADGLSITPLKAAPGARLSGVAGDGTRGVVVAGTRGVQAVAF